MCSTTAVKSNALAELMNRTSKIHWKNLSLTLNGRNSETKNDKNNQKVPKFSSCRGLSSTHESVVAPLFMPFLAYMGPFLAIFWVLEVALFQG